MKYNIYKGVLYRFWRAGLASAFASMALIITSFVSTNGVQATVNDIPNLLNALTASGIVGCLTGFIQAGDKYFRAKKTL